MVSKARAKLMYLIVLSWQLYEVKYEVKHEVKHLIPIPCVVTVQVNGNDKILKTMRGVHT